TPDLRIVVLDLARGKLLERLHLDLVDDGVEDPLALPVAGAAEDRDDHALPVLGGLVPKADRRRLAARAKLLGDRRVVEVEGERRDRGGRATIEGRPPGSPRP